MPSRDVTKKPIRKRLSLNLKAQHTNAISKKIISEQKKEIARLQKLLAKAEVKHQSEIAKVRAQEFEKYARRCLQITPYISAQEAVRRYTELINGGKD